MRIGALGEDQTPAGRGMKGRKPQVKRGGGVPPEADLRWCRRHKAAHSRGGWVAYAEERAAPCVFAWPQQKSGPTEVNENNGVDPLSSEVCAGPLREKGTAKGEKCDRKTQKTVHLLGGGWQATPKSVGQVPVMKVITRGL